PQPAVALPPAAGLRQGAPGRAHHGRVRSGERARRAGDRPGGAELRAAARRRVLPEGRVLLLHPADARPGRDPAHAGGVPGRPEAAERREYDRALVHVLRGCRQERKELMEAAMKPASFLDTVKTVLWG